MINKFFINFGFLNKSINYIILIILLFVCYFIKLEKAISNNYINQKENF